MLPVISNQKGQEIARDRKNNGDRYQHFTCSHLLTH